MIKVKESKISFFTAAITLAAIICLCLLLPTTLTKAESNSGTLGILGVTYIGGDGFVIRTDDDTADFNADASFISVFDTNGNELKVNAGSFSGGSGSLSFSLVGAPGCEMVGGGKLLFKKGFYVSSSGKKLAEDNSWSSEKTDGETFILVFSEVKPDEKSESSESFDNSESPKNSGSSESCESSAKQSEQDKTSEELSASETAGEEESQSEEIVESDEPFPIDEPFAIDEPFPIDEPTDESKITSESESSETSESESSETSESESDESNESDGGEAVRPSFNIGGNKGDNDSAADGSDNNDGKDGNTEISDVKIEEINVEKDFYVLKIGEEATVLPMVLPENATEKYTYSFTTENVATYENSILKGVAAGETELVFKAENAEKRIKIIVLGDDELYEATPEFGNSALKIRLSESVLFDNYVYSAEQITEATKFIVLSGCEIKAVHSETADNGGCIIIEFAAADENSYAVVGKGFPIYSALNGESVKIGTIANDISLRFVGGKTEEIIGCEEIIVPESVKILLFQTEKLDVKTVPENVNFGKPTFSSDNEEIATVDEDGNITAVMRGKCKITVTFLTPAGSVLKKTVDVEVYDEIVDITRDTDIVLTIKDNKIIAGDLEFTFTYKSGLVIKKTIQNATLGYKTDESGNFIGTISFIEDGEEYSFEVPVSLNISGCGGGCNDGCGSAIKDNHGVLTGYILALVLSAVFIFINKKTD